MEQVAFQIGRIAIWALPLAWCLFAWMAFRGGLMVVGIGFGIAGVCLLLRNVMFLETLTTPGRSSNFSYFFVPYSEAPFGFLLSYLLPFASNVGLIVACVFLLGTPCLTP